MRKKDKFIIDLKKSAAEKKEVEETEGFQKNKRTFSLGSLNSGGSLPNLGISSTTRNFKVKQQEKYLKDLFNDDFMIENENKINVELASINSNTKTKYNIEG